MGLVGKQYEVMENAPKEIGWSHYYAQTMEEYDNLLRNEGDSEKIFQDFFERNPAFLPGALELFGHSGHYPYMHTLVSQPEIGGCFTRIPDFVWLSQDSLNFCPVFIEIEKPNKKTFNQQGVASADFTQALGQIKQWRSILNNPINVQLFYDYFDIPLYMRKKQFKPQYLLIYGRRGEYENNERLTAMRSELEEVNVALMSYERLKPLADYSQFTTCKVKDKEYRVIHIPPTYRYRADCADVLYSYKNFYESIVAMERVTEERKHFLQERYEYWMSFEGNLPGIITSMEGE